MKNLITPILLFLLGVILHLQADKNQQKEQFQIETAGIEVRSQNIDIEQNNSLKFDENSNKSYSSIIKKNVIPLQIFDFFNIL